jgi:transcriptional regulator with XRE-family HTH domain
MKRLREANGFSQRALAMKAKVSQSLIHQLETGKIQDARSRAVMQLAKALSEPVTELLG